MISRTTINNPNGRPELAWVAQPGENVRPADIRAAYGAHYTLGDSPVLPFGGAFLGLGLALLGDAPTWLTILCTVLGLCGGYALHLHLAHMYAVAKRRLTKRARVFSSNLTHSTELADLERIASSLAQLAPQGTPTRVRPTHSIGTRAFKPRSPDRRRQPTSPSQLPRASYDSTMAVMHQLVWDAAQVEDPDLLRIPLQRAREMYYAACRAAEEYTTSSADVDDAFAHLTLVTEASQSPPHGRRRGHGPDQPRQSTPTEVDR